VDRARAVVCGGALPFLLSLAAAGPARAQGPIASPPKTPSIQTW